MEIKEVKDLARMLMFELSDKEAEDIIADFVTFDRQLALLDAVDTEGVEEMIYPFEVKTSYLREDIGDHVISQEEALKNASKVKEGHIVVPKVVK